MSALSLVLACLRALDIEEAQVSLDGSGDSGDATWDHARKRSGEAVLELPRITIDIEGHTLDSLICHVASDLLEGDWVNNEGGYGTVTFRPFEDDPDAAFECDMTYRDEYEGEDDPDFIDDEEGDDEEHGDQSGQENDVVTLPQIVFAEGGRQ